MKHLYHGTSETYLSSIKQKGLKPRGFDRGNWIHPGQVSSHHEMVYLTNAEMSAEFYGLNSALCNNDSQYVILKIDYNGLNEDKFYPDENYMTTSKLIPPQEMKDAQAQIISNKDKWKECLTTKNLVCYKDNIQPDVLAYNTKNIKENLWYNLFCSEEGTYNEFINKFFIWIEHQKTFMNTVHKEQCSLFDCKILKTSEGYVFQTSTTT